MNSESTIISQTSQPIAPEDIQPGDYVAVLNIIIEALPPVCFSDSQWTKAPQPVRFSLLPWTPSEPLKVVEVCLPFVLVKRPTSKCARSGSGFAAQFADSNAFRTLDVRRYRLARLSKAYGKRVFKMLRGKRASKDEGQSK